MGGFEVISIKNDKWYRDSNITIIRYSKPFSIKDIEIFLTDYSIDTHQKTSMRVRYWKSKNSYNPLEIFILHPVVVGND
jgi:hypothetical protein